MDIAKLAKHGADFNKAGNTDGTTPALLAAQEGHHRVIAELAKHRVDFNKADHEGTTPARLAAQNGHHWLLLNLQSMEPISIKPIMRVQPLL